jgi:hypothetical protein
MEDAFLRKQWEEICGAYFDAVEMGGGELDVEFP